jgi:hypothetical protein
MYARIAIRLCGTKKMRQEAINGTTGNKVLRKMTDEEYLEQCALEDKYTKPPTFFELTQAFGDCRYLIARRVYDRKKKNCYDYPYSDWWKFLRYTKFSVSGDMLDRLEIEKIKQIPIQDLYDFKVMRETSERITAFCPFHDERQSSFTIYKKSNSFYCFSCQSGGDGISFISKLHNCDFMTAVSKMKGLS